MILDFAVVGVLTGVVIGHLVHVLFYHPEELGRLAGAQGLGGAVVDGRAAGRDPGRGRSGSAGSGSRFAGYSDALALGIAPGWGVARVGCFSVHDHPGLPSDFFLAVNMDGGPATTSGSTRPSCSSPWVHCSGRSTGAGSCAACCCRCWRCCTAPAASCSTSCAPGRSEGLYADARYLGLTPAQYIVVALVAYSVAWRLATRRRTGGGAGDGGARAE